MTIARIQIQDTPTGVRFAGQLAYSSSQITSPAEQIAAYLEANQEAIARQSWAWFASQNVAIEKLNQE
jgi:hypothetical protein